jgi:hypothetical protein
MTAPATLIEDQIASLMVSDSRFDTLNAIFRGVPYRVPTQYWPYAMVVIATETTLQEFTGGKVERGYAGVIQFHVIHQDVVEVTGRTARIPSYDVVHVLVNSTVVAFKEETKRSLAGFTFVTGAVEQIVIGEDQIEYGFAPQNDRDDAFMNYGSVPFVVRTMESMG